MKLGVVGKGGVGKTSLSGLLCQAYVARGKKVLAVDTDSNPNLAMSLGLDEKTANEAPLVPRKLVVGMLILNGGTAGFYGGPRRRTVVEDSYVDEEPVVSSRRRVVRRRDVI